MIKKVIICITIVFQILFAQKYKSSEIIKNIEISVGYNYSEFISTKNIGGNGINIGLHKRKKIRNNWQLKYGLNYTTKQSKLKNVIVLPMYLIDWDSDNYIYWRNFELDFTYIDINSSLEIPVYHQENFNFHISIGCGFEINRTKQYKMENIKHELYDKEIDKYDYWTGDYEDHSFIIPNMINSGLTIKIGGSFIYKQIVLNIYYNKSLNSIDYVDHMKFGEKFHTFNTTLGFIIR